MIAQRVLAVLAAALLVGAVALAMLGPPSVPLGQALFMLDHDLMNALHGSIERHVSAWLWDHLEPIVAKLVAWIPLQTFKQWLADRVDALSPAMTLIVFAVPVIPLFPLKLVGLWLLIKPQAAFRHRAGKAGGARPGAMAVGIGDRLA